MTIYFANKEAIDLSAISVMGVSVKTNDSPIGYFGTGLKFSIATLLRTGHEVQLIRNGEEIRFSVESKLIRGEAFDVVKMGDELLGFTTKLGRNWEPWQAYRELYCNCLDESGIISDAPSGGEWGTVFKIDGEAITQCHRNRHEIFLATNPFTVTEDCEVHNATGQHAFYRGVRAHKHGSPALFTYNIKAPIEITEDRTIKHSFMISYYAEAAVALSDDEDFIETAVLAPSGTFESKFDYGGAGKPSAAFMATCFRLRNTAHANLHAIRLWEKHADVRLTYEEAELDAFEEDLLDKALLLVARIGAKLCRADFTVVEGLGEGIFGLVRGSKILLARRAFDMGHRFVASTLYEEWLHRDQGLRDETRDMQNLLFEKLFAMVERVSVFERRTAPQLSTDPSSICDGSLCGSSLNNPTSGALR